jgi:hypothetical protein
MSIYILLYLEYIISNFNEDYIYKYLNVSNIF